MSGQFGLRLWDRCDAGVSSRYELGELQTFAFWAAVTSASGFALGETVFASIGNPILRGAASNCTASAVLNTARSLYGDMSIPGFVSGLAGSCVSGALSGAIAGRNDPLSDQITAVVTGHLFGSVVRLASELVLNPDGPLY